ncbi:hypothetical protein GCM10023085_09350 [Actinomadura viridis]|uniref:Uncharacterized protein n=1 Tax=Actinomadura viridis TaxID=58110 RepID=A0A931DQ32_9ACTN|nr:hypothetical protein [Actinomadura viridis]MBG6091947.1 hypothetical protein [Actinomadura viridis]
MSEAPGGNWTGGTLPAGTSSASVFAHAAGAGWVLENDMPRTVTGPRCWTWRAPEGQASLVEDHRTGLRHVEAQPAPFAERLVAELRLERGPELVERARTAADPLERMRALQALDFQQHSAAMVAAETAPEDPDSPGHALLPDTAPHLEAFERGLDDPVPGVRRAAVGGLAYSVWPGSREILRRRRGDLPAFAELIDQRLDAELPRINTA